MEGQTSLVLQLMTTSELERAYVTLRRRHSEAMETGTAYEVGKWMEDLEAVAAELTDRGVTPDVPF